MGGASLPPGFRFHPTDEELIGYYLKRKVEGLEIELEVIPVIDLYKFDPWELPEKSFLPKRDMEWFFFCPRDRKYPNGSRTNRATKAGYWKATGKDRKVVCQSSVTGYRKTLVFYRGRAPLGDRTEWVMHEYRLCDDISQGSPSFQGGFALCRVIKKNDHTLKTSDVHGEPKAKQVGSSSSNMNFTSAGISNEAAIISDDTHFQTSYPCNESNYSSTITSPYQTSMMECEPASMGTNPTSLWVSPDLILDSSKEYPQGQSVPGFNPQYEFPNSMSTWQPYNPYEISPSSSYSNFTEEVELADDLNRFSSMSPYSGNVNYMGFHGNEDVSYEGFGTWNQTPICRQSSGDGSLGELGSLWSQEDNLVIVM
ncbi:NAC domain-containing protein 71-like [Cornus florida]|uniref:NAC domain-containing protein 71-like n=1 Tax=Cornus florida TaxID=4283 RepID=UPI0028993F74|nr:NAC domain-containing protein 71-like [Cornus florida]